VLVEVVAQDGEQRDRASARLGLRLDRSLVLVPGALDPDQARRQVAFTALQGLQLAPTRLDRVEDVADRPRVESLRQQFVDEALYVGPLDLADPDPGQPRSLDVTGERLLVGPLARDRFPSAAA
jgi:hypothetical protein